MKRHILGSILAFGLLSGLSVAQKICVAAPGGGDANVFNLQQSLYKATSDELKARGQNPNLQLLASNYEKSARKEAAGYKCDYTVVTDLSREWPTPKSNSGGGVSMGGKKDDDDHPPSISHFRFYILDKDGKRVDKFETQIEMQPGFTAANVKDKVQEIIQQVANLAADYVTPQK